jgi:hypothetical protein
MSCVHPHDLYQYPCLVIKFSSTLHLHSGCNITPLDRWSKLGGIHLWSCTLYIPLRKTSFRHSLPRASHLSRPMELLCDRKVSTRMPFAADSQLARYRRGTRQCYSSPDQTFERNPHICFFQRVPRFVPWVAHRIEIERKGISAGRRSRGSKLRTVRTSCRHTPPVHVDIREPVFLGRRRLERSAHFRTEPVVD